DCRAAGLPGEPAEFFRDSARVQLSAGGSYGAEGNGFVRMNFATSGQILTEILRRMTAAANMAAAGAPSG
ncbi:hypothetical protein ACFQ07_09945, partial [Actinomadura adrarensis]